MRMLLLISLGGLLMLSARAQPPANDPQDVATAVCIADNVAAEHDQTTRDMLVAILQEDKILAEANALKLGFAIAQAAMSDCGLDVKDFESARFETIARIAGEMIGERVMGDAMRKIGFE